MRTLVFVLMLTLPVFAQGTPALVSCSKVNSTDTWHWLEAGLECHATPPSGTPVTVHDDVDGNGDKTVIAPVKP